MSTTSLQLIENAFNTQGGIGISEDLNILDINHIDSITIVYPNKTDDLPKYIRRIKRTIKILQYKK